MPPPHPLVLSGGAPSRERGWESPNSNEGTYTVVLFIYTYFVTLVLYRQAVLALLGCLSQPTIRKCKILIRFLYWFTTVSRSFLKLLKHNLMYILYTVYCKAIIQYYFLYLQLRYFWDYIYFNNFSTVLFFAFVTYYDINMPDMN